MKRAFIYNILVRVHTYYALLVETMCRKFRSQIQFVEVAKIFPIFIYKKHVKKKTKKNMAQ